MGNTQSEEQERTKSTDTPAFSFAGSSATPASGTDAFSGAHNSSSQQLITPPGKSNQTHNSNVLFVKINKYFF